MQIQNTGGLCWSCTNGFYKLLSSVLRHEERDTILAMLTILPDAPPTNARRILRCLRSQFIRAGRHPKNVTAAATVENSNHNSMIQCQLLN